ncbi:methanol/ethanol family PQQ-dependent dehydrogenase [Enterovibrio baiacu]|uniref:methanol/ethanol family PQQ-dependent dehydrogenase n=1 Tax=Enterovibrio baiacu TaxID=2491023 RepID=UPI0010133731|nr:methanol/ethanol family PQQ-dependent dehydrogenase [Enterovibrio baiacu]MBE1276409.1 PQQ-dependent dehydrogenase, methanol/ethanol family [Enterovibrio baiacu]
MKGAQRSFSRGLAITALSLPMLFSATSQANDELLKLQDDPNQWVMWGANYSGTRYSSLDQINAKNAKDLQVAWTFSTGVLRGHEGGPLVIGNTMYIHTPFPNKVFAINMDKQALRWSYEPKQDSSVIAVMCCDTVNRGLAYSDGKIFLQQADTTLVALDENTGEVVWKVVNGDPKVGATNTNAPLVVKDKIITGISGGEFGVRGYLTAYNVKDGSVAWRAYSTGPDDEMLVDPEKTTEMLKPIGKDASLKTWEGDQWKIGGGTTWGWFTYDPELNLIYYGTGNPSTWNPSQRPGDNKYSMTIMARDADTGMAKWLYQMTPHDEWDYDGVNEMILVDKTFNGKDRKLLVHFDRNGFGYTLDRVTGELLVAEKFDPAVNWATHVDMETGRPQVVAKYSTDQNGEDVDTTGVCPAALGSKDQQPATYSERTGLFYVPTNHVCMNYEPFEVSYTAGQPYVGATLSMFPAPDSHGGLGNFIAWDAEKGEIVWSIPEPFSVWSGALATGGGIVFYGTLEGYLKAVDEKTGKELYRFKTPSGIIGNVNTYMHNGKQYIAVLSGVGGWAGIGMAAGLEGDTDGLGAVGAYRKLSDYTQLGGVLTVFALPES